jgi:hypothetical protein
MSREICWKLDKAPCQWPVSRGPRRRVNNELISACNLHGLVEGECLSLDNTFKSVAKATVVDKSKG